MFDGFAPRHVPDVRGGAAWARRHLHMGGAAAAGPDAAARPESGAEPLLQHDPPPPPPPVTRRPADVRMERYIEAAAKLSESSAPQCAAVLRSAKPAFAALLNIVILVATGYAKLYSHMYDVYSSLPLNQIQMIVGLLLCFFGGTYVTLIAAFEAFRTMGGQVLNDHLAFVWHQVKIVAEAEHIDSLLDENRNGIADVDEIGVDQLAQRKLKVCMKAVTDPVKLQSAVGSLWAACLAVLATLKLQFAQTAAYAMAIADLVKFPVLRATAPFVTWGLGPELVQWCDPIIDSTLRVLCILLVWSLSKVRAAFYSGIRGGKLFAEALISFCAERGWMDKLPDSIASKPFAADESYLDEAIAYSMAAVGFYWQLSNMFFLPFPVDWILWPVSLAERLLEVQVAWA